MKKFSGWQVAALKGFQPSHTYLVWKLFPFLVIDPTIFHFWSYAPFLVLDTTIFENKKVFHAWRHSSRDILFCSSES